MNYALVYYLKSHQEEINAIREKYDPMVHIINPHVTIIFPIPQSEIEEKVLISHLGNQIKTVKPFKVHFDGLERSWDNYLFLSIKEGKEKLIELHDNLYRGVLLSFLRRDIQYSPHITLGVFKEKSIYAKAEEDAKKLNFSFEEIIDTVSLIKGDSKSSPKTIVDFSL